MDLSKPWNSEQIAFYADWAASNQTLIRSTCNNNTETLNPYTSAKIKKKKKKNHLLSVWAVDAQSSVMRKNSSQKNVYRTSLVLDRVISR